MMDQMPVILMNLAEQCQHENRQERPKMSSVLLELDLLD